MTLYIFTLKQLLSCVILGTLSGFVLGACAVARALTTLFKVES